MQNELLGLPGSRRIDVYGPEGHPYIPNSEPAVKADMLRAIGIADIDELYADIPPELRLARPLDIPAAIGAEATLVRHMEELLDRNRTVKDHLSFLGAGCYSHHVPAVCDEVNGRGEFLTSYAGRAYEEHGKYQALWEYQSMMGELLEMDVVSVPFYDGAQTAATALRMASRLTGRRNVAVSAHASVDRRARIREYSAPDIAVQSVPHDPATGFLDLEALESMLDDTFAAVYVENPSGLGLIELGLAEIGRLVHQVNALLVVGVDPISLGVLQPPAAIGADIVTGDLQPLGIHLQWGGGLGGFLATNDDPAIVAEFPYRMYSIAPTVVPGEYGFAEVLHEGRVGHFAREKGKEFAGTAAALWGVTAGVYMALMGPRGMAEIGDGIMARTRYGMDSLARLPGIHVPWLTQHHFQEFMVDFTATGRTVREINADLRAAAIFGGVDLSKDYPELGQTALYCFSELHTRGDIDRLTDTLGGILQ